MTSTLADNMNLIARDESLQGASSFKPKNVALIACPWTFYEEVEFVSQQLGLGYVGAYAQQFGHKIVAFIDPMIGEGQKFKERIQTKYQHTYRFGYPDEWIVEQIPSNTDVIAINAPFTDSRIVLYPLVKRIKDKYPETIVVIGGVLATTLPRQVLVESGGDIVIKGEGEVAFSKILNGVVWSDIPGTVYRNTHADIVEHPLRSEQLVTVDQIPPPGYNFRPMDEYVKWSPRGDRSDRTLSLISSRGCPFSCSFCSIPEKGQLWRPFTPERVIEEIEEAIKKWGVNHIEFEDDNFTLKEPRALKVLGYLRELRQKGHQFTCSFPNGIMIDKMTEDLAILLKEAGSDIIYLPVESGDERVLYSMDKPLAHIHLAQTLQVAKWCVDAGLRTSCFFIVAYPGGYMHKKYSRNKEEMLTKYGSHILESNGDQLFMRGEDQESYEETLRFCQKLIDIGVEAITPLIATPYPGTDLYSACQKFGWLAFEDDPNVLTTVSYAAMRPEFIQIETPWCTRVEAYERWRHMMDMFQSFHNVRKVVGSDRLLTGREVGNIL
jgi:magnesium-protoporphyrin IX monomethyl ester (oxidative) cyclase